MIKVEEGTYRDWKGALDGNEKEHPLDLNVGNY